MDIYKALESIGGRIVSGEQLEREGSVKFIDPTDSDNEVAELFPKVEQNFNFYLVSGQFQDYEFVSEPDFWDMELVNQSYRCITVKDEQAASQWQAAYHEWMVACWEPNQSYETKEANSKIMAEAKAVMDRLEAEAKALA